MSYNQVGRPDRPEGTVAETGREPREAGSDMSSDRKCRQTSKLGSDISEAGNVGRSNRKWPQSHVRELPREVRTCQRGRGGAGPPW